MKKKIIITFIVFLLGITVGAIGMVYIFGQTSVEAAELVEIQWRADLAKRVSQAYSEEKPEVAIWALKNLVEVLEERVKLSDEGSVIQQSTQRDLVLSHARLAIVFQQIGDTSQFKQNIEKALKFAKESGWTKMKTEEDILNFTKKLGDCKKK